MATHKVRPDLGSAEAEESYQRRAKRNRTLDALAIVAGIVIVAAIGIQVVFVASDPAEPDTGVEAAETRAVQIEAETGPAETASPAADDAEREGIGLPPKGTAPSTPKEGELVAHYGHPQGAGFVFVYTDGRVISQGGVGNPGRDGLYERRLTPEGVELVRSGAVKAERFVMSSNPVPASAWEDAEIKPYVPSRYAVCYLMERGGDYVSPSTVLRFFPAQAREILGGKDHTYPTADQDPLECSEVTTDEARALDNTLRDARVVDAKGDQIAWEINTLLPHGVWPAFMFG